MLIEKNVHVGSLGRPRQRQWWWRPLQVTAGWRDSRAASSVWRCTTGLWPSARASWGDGEAGGELCVSGLWECSRQVIDFRGPWEVWRVKSPTAQKSSLGGRGRRKCPERNPREVGLWGHREEKASVRRVWNEDMEEKKEPVVKDQGTEGAAERWTRVYRVLRRRAPVGGWGTQEGGWHGWAGRGSRALRLG